MAINKTKLTVKVNNAKITPFLKYDLLVTYTRPKSGRLPEKDITIKPVTDAIFTSSRNEAITSEHKISVNNIIKVIFVIKLNNEAVKLFDATGDILKGKFSSWKLPTTFGSSLKDLSNERKIVIKRKEYIVWKGTYLEISLGKKIVDTKVYDFYLTSDCVFGIKYIVHVRATAEVFVSDVSILGDASAGKGEAKFYQKPNTLLEPKIFNGVFVLGSISAGFGHTYAGPVAMGKTLGDTGGPGVSTDVYAIEMGRGNAEVVSYTRESCN